MTIRSILRVKKDDHEYYVVAEPFWAKHNIKHLNTQTKKFMSTKNVNYRLFILEDGKINGVLGFIDSLEPGMHCLNVLDTPHINDTVPFLEYHQEDVFIVEKIFSS